MEKYYVMDDMKVQYHEGFVANEEDSDECMANYSGYYVVKSFETREGAEAFCNDYNSYAGEPDVHLDCCSMGCKMTAWEYARWNGQCTYMGQFDDED